MNVRDWLCAGALAAAGALVICGWAAGALAGGAPPWSQATPWGCLDIQQGGPDVECTA